MVRYFGGLYDKFILLTPSYMISAISIGFNIQYINIIIFKTFYIKYHIFNLVHHLSRI